MVFPLYHISSLLSTYFKMCFLLWTKTKLTSHVFLEVIDLGWSFILSLSLWYAGSPWIRNLWAPSQTPWPIQTSSVRPWQPTPVLLPGESHGRRSLVGCSPLGHEESDTSEQLPFPPYLSRLCFPIFSGIISLPVIRLRSDWVTSGPPSSTLPLQDFAEAMTSTRNTFFLSLPHPHAFILPSFSASSEISLVV